MWLMVHRWREWNHPYFTDSMCTFRPHLINGLKWSTTLMFVFVVGEKSEATSDPAPLSHHGWSATSQPAFSTSFMRKCQFLITKALDFSWARFESHLCLIQFSSLSQASLEYQGCGFDFSLIGWCGDEFIVYGIWDEFIAEMKVWCPKVICEK